MATKVKAPTTPDISSWDDIRDDFTGGTLLLGNGSSIAISPKFRYESLYEKALEQDLFNDEVQRLFGQFKTRDFELILKMLWHCYLVNIALSTPNPLITELYVNIRNGLIDVVRSIHCSYSDVESRVELAGQFSRQFSTILSLNYDLLVYWMIQQSNAGNSGHRFKDCFVNGTFDHPWDRFRNRLSGETGVTLVFYPHGNLLLADHSLQGELKLTASASSDLLSAVFQRWEADHCKPVFVSEGESSQKERSIRRSEYLSTVLYDVMPRLNGSLVIYGWGIGENDTHILKAINRSDIDKVAIGIYDPSNNAETECAHAIYAIRNHIKRTDGVDVRFFDASEPGVWCHSA